MTSKTLLGGYEAFKCTGTSFIGGTAVNAVAAMNNSGGFLFKDMTFIIEENSGNPDPYNYFGSPIMDISSNVAGGFAGAGGMIENITMTHEGAVDADGLVLTGIVVRQNNPDITIMGGRYEIPEELEFTLSSPSSGAVGFIGGDENILVDGYQVIGNTVFGSGGIIVGSSPNSVLGGVVRNCIVNNIISFTPTLLQNNQTNSKTITTAPNQVGFGSVQFEPVQTKYSFGKTVTLTPNPSPGFFFSNWSGAIVSTDNPLQFVVPGDAHLIANFESAPVGMDDSYTVPEGGMLFALDAVGGGDPNNDSVLVNDTEGDLTTAVKLTEPSYQEGGIITLNSDGTFIYTHDGSETIADSFTYRPDDSDPGTPATVNISITPVNDPPEGQNDSYTVPEGGILSVTDIDGTATPGNANDDGLLVNDSDDEGDSFTAAVVSGFNNAASFNVNPDGSFSYTHDGSETTNDLFIYQVSDADPGNTPSAFITITPVNDAPDGVDDTYRVAFGGTLTVNDADGTVTGGDSSDDGVLVDEDDPENDPLTATLETGPTKAASFNLMSDGTFTYQHDGIGATPLVDSFTYRANDGLEDSAITTATIIINNPPTGVADNFVVAEGGTLEVDDVDGTTTGGDPSDDSIILNDLDNEGDTLSAELVSGPSNAASFNLNADGTFSYTHDGSETNLDSFTYRPNDGSPGSEATVTITVTSVNDPPESVVDDYALAEGGILNANDANGSVGDDSDDSVLVNDTDAEDDSLTAILDNGPSNSVAFQLFPNGTFNYQHDDSENLTDSFTYHTNDGQKNGNSTTANLTMIPVNDSPQITQNLGITVDEGSAANIIGGGLLAAADPDDNDPGLVFTIDVSPTNGTLFSGGSPLGVDDTFLQSQITGNQISYAHNGSETTADTFDFTTRDDEVPTPGETDQTSFNILVTPVNDPPQGFGDIYNIQEGGNLLVDDPDGAASPGDSTDNSVILNDFDSEGDPLAAELVSPPANADSFNLFGDGTFDYQNNGAEATLDSFVYRPTDPAMGSAATVTIIISPVNDPPVGSPDTYEVPVGGTLTVDDIDGTASVGDPSDDGVLINDLDSELDSLTALLVSPPLEHTGGPFTLNSDGSFTYVHDGSEPGTDSFTYRPRDSEDGTIAIVTIAINNPPSGVDDAFSISEGGNLVVDDPDGDATSGDLTDDSILLNDIDTEDDLITAVLETGPVNGILAILNPNGTFTYTHDGGESTFDSFVYHPDDGVAGSSATVAITIVAVNDPPTGVEDTYTVPEGGILDVNDANGSFGDSNNDGVLFNDTDIEDDILTATLLTQPTNAGAAVLLDPSGTFVYNHDGSETSMDSFTYQPEDADPGTIATISITITSVNDDPNIPVNTGLTVIEGTSNNVIQNSKLSATDPDSDDSSLLYTLTEPPLNGTLFRDAFALGMNDTFTQNDIDNLNTLSYSHNGSETTSDSFEFTVQDDNLPVAGVSNSTIFNITVLSDNDPPIGVNDAATLDEGASFNSTVDLLDTEPGADSVLDNDTDTEGDSLSAVLSLAPTNSPFFNLNANGTFEYTHDGSETTDDTFSYVPNDSDPGTLATVNLTIIPQNDNYAVEEGETLSATDPDGSTGGPEDDGVLANDSDGEGTPITAILDSGPIHADTFNLNSDGTFSYEHDGGEDTFDSFTYLANDGLADSNNATVNITIQPANDPPDSVNDNFTVGEGANLEADDLDGSDGDPNNDGLLANDSDMEGNALTAVLVSNGIVNEGGGKGTSGGEEGEREGGLPPPPFISEFESGPSFASSFTFNGDGSFSYTHDGSENLVDFFAYRAEDTEPGNVALVTITVTPVNDPPLGVNDSYTIFEGATLTADDADGSVGDPNNDSVKVNDLDPEGDTITTTLLTGPNSANSFNFNADGTFTYTHDGSEGLSDTFIYVPDDGETGPPATVTITLQPVNDPPEVSLNEEYVFDEGSFGNIISSSNLAATDVDDVDSGLVFAVQQVPAEGTLRRDGLLLGAGATFTQLQLAGNSVTYNHGGSDSPTDSFQLTVRDDGLPIPGESQPFLVSISVNPVNDAPMGVNDAATVTEGSSYDSSIDLLDTPLNATTILDNDTDSEGNPLTADLINAPGNASSFTLNLDGSFTYTHNGTETLADNFTYRPKDADNGSLATVNLTITPANDPPNAVNDGGPGFLTDEDTPITTGNVLTNDSDPDAGDTVSLLSIDTSNTAGLVIDNGNGTFNYDPNQALNFLQVGDLGSDTFTYTAEDLAGETNAATVSITILGANDPPVLGNTNLSIARGGAVFLTSAFLSATDPDHLDATLNFVVTSVTGGQFDSASAFGVPITQFTLQEISANSVRFVDDGDAFPPSFDVSVFDPAGLSDGPISAFITFDALNDPSNAVDDLDFGPAFSTDEATPFITGNVLDNDSDPNAEDILSIQSIDLQFTVGEVFNVGDGTFIYDPNGKYNALQAGQLDTDIFTYIVQDQKGAIDTATVTIFISGLNPPPPPDLTLTRSLPGNYLPEVGNPVSITITPSLGVTDYTVEDTIPEGWTAEGVSDNGSFDPPSGVVSFSLIGDQVRTLTYSVVPPPGESGSRLFSGFGSVAALTAPITGDFIISSPSEEGIQPLSNFLDPGDDNSGPEDDFSQDGLSNLEAYFMGLDPTDNNSGAGPTTGIVSDDGSIFLIMTFRRGKFVENVSFRIQQSTDLVTYVDLVAPIIAIVGEDANSWTIQAKIPVADVIGFLRLLVEQTP